MKAGQFTKVAGLTAAAALALTACSDSGDSGDGGSGEGGGTVTLGIIPSWTDGLSMAHLWKVILEEEGYTVEIKEMQEAAPLYTAVAEGDYDVYPSAWPEITHAEYMDQYGDDLEDLGAYYENAKLTMAVPEYTDIDSIEDLAGNADQFGGEIVGIEPGAGLTDQVSNHVIPDYELGGDYELLTSSTTSMLTELEQAVENEEDIVVTLWRPFWANAEYPVKDLEDPQGSLGESETLNAIANAEFSSEFPDVAEWMGSLTLDDEQYGELEDLVVNQHEDDPAAGAEEFVENNQDLIDSVTE
ncbi:glycine betaine ABC transporter substrate-binding protein [Nesterenkonia halophila]